MSNLWLSRPSHSWPDLRDNQQVEVSQSVNVCSSIDPWRACVWLACALIPLTLTQTTALVSLFALDWHGFTYNLHFISRWFKLDLLDKRALWTVTKSSQWMNLTCQALADWHLQNGVVVVVILDHRSPPCAILPGSCVRRFLKRWTWPPRVVNRVVVSSRRVWDVYNRPASLKLTIKTACPNGCSNSSKWCKLILQVKKVDTLETCLLPTCMCSLEGGEVSQIMATCFLSKHIQQAHCFILPSFQTGARAVDMGSGTNRRENTQSEQVYGTFQQNVILDTVPHTAMWRAKRKGKVHAQVLENNETFAQIEQFQFVFGNTVGTVLRTHQPTRLAQEHSGDDERVQCTHRFVLFIQKLSNCAFNGQGALHSVHVSLSPCPYKLSTELNFFLLF